MKKRFPEAGVCAVSHPADCRPGIAWLRMRVEAYFTGLSATFRIVRRLISANAIRRLGRMLAAREEDVQPDTDKTYPVSIRVECPDMSVVSKSLNTSQEKQIRDLNLYLYHETNPEADRHIYSDAVSGPLMTELVAGSLYPICSG